MLEKIVVKNTANDKEYEGFCAYNGDPLIYFKKKVLKEIIEDFNKTNQFFSCDIRLEYHKENDEILFIDNEFSNHTEHLYSYMLYTHFGLMKLYSLGNAIDWDVVSEK